MKDLRRGFVAMTPLLPGIAVFGLLYGVLARQAGLTPFQAWGMSMTVFAGASQFVAAGMWDHSVALTIIITTLVINLRHLLMGLSIGPYLVGLPRRWKAALAFWMTDESDTPLPSPITGKGTRDILYFLGASLAIYLAWPVSGLVGAAAGMAVPDTARWGLDLVFPLAFLGLLVMFITDRLSLIVALTAGVFALVVGVLVAGDMVRDRCRGAGQYCGVGAGTPAERGLAICRTRGLCFWEWPS